MTASKQQPAGKLAAESVQRVADLTRDAVEAQIRLTGEYADLARTVLSKDTDRLAVGRAYLESAQREALTYLGRVTELAVGYTADVITLGQQVTRTVFGDITAAAGPSPEAKPAAKPEAKPQRRPASKRQTSPRARRQTSPRATTPGTTPARARS